MRSFSNPRFANSIVLNTLVPKVARLIYLLNFFATFCIFKILSTIDGGAVISYSCSQLAVTCSELTTETLEEGVKYQS